DPVVLENCGTFFSQPDVVAPGCDQNLAVLTNDPDLVGLLNDVFGDPHGLSVTPSEYGEGLLVKRGADRNARDDGQWGIAFRYMFEPLDTEFGIYSMNYHSRLPIFSGAGPDATTQTLINSEIGIATAGAAFTAANGQYFIEYPEDIRLHGV